MNKNQISAETRHATSLQMAAAEEQYVAPHIEIIDIEMNQNILAGSQGTNPLPDMPGGGWG